jgi:hypothetical protein
MTRLWLWPILLWLPAAAADVDSLLSEPNLEKRAGKAMDFARHRLDAARAAYHDGKTAEVGPALEDVAAAVELARESLKQTGKNASKSPKHFKRAELGSRALLKRLDAFIHDMSFDDRAPAEKTRDRVRKVQEALLLDIMGGGKRR